MNREVHVRFYERLGVELPGPTHPPEVNILRQRRRPNDRAMETCSVSLAHVAPALSGKCDHCIARGPLGFASPLAFQPLVDVHLETLFSYEGPVRGSQGQPASWVLVRFQPDILKIDMDLVRGIESDRPRQAVVHGILVMCAELGIRVLAEGVETSLEYGWLRDAGVNLFQGYLFGRPGFETLPSVDFTAIRRASSR